VHTFVVLKTAALSDSLTGVFRNALLHVSYNEIGWRRTAIVV
jgi:hypothetical protein